MNNQSALEQLLHPMTVEYFFQQYLGRKPCLIKANNSDQYSHLLSLAQFEDLIGSVKADSGLLSHKPSKAHLFNLNGADGFVSPQAVLNGYMAGGTIHMRAMDKLHKPIKVFFNQLRSSLESHGLVVDKMGDAVVFLTPKQSVALEPHSDPEDLFILQLEGCKVWKFFGDSPDISAHGSKLSTVPPLSMELTLQPGDVLYVPRGFIHHANTEQSHSLAVTLGYKLMSLAKWIRAELDNAIGDDHALYLPLSTAAVAEHSELMRQCVVKLQQSLDQVRANDVIEGAANRLAIMPVNSLEQANQINEFDLNTQMWAKLKLAVRHSSGKVCLYNRLTHISGPLVFEPIFSWIAKRTGSFCMADLNAEIKLEVEQEFQLGFGKRLLMEGLCELATKLEKERL